MGGIRDNNSDSKINEYVTYGKLSQQLKNSGYEVKINGETREDTADTKFLGGEVVSVNKSKSPKNYLYTVALTEKSINLVAWSLIDDADSNGNISVGDEVENSLGERFYIIPNPEDAGANKITLFAKYNLNIEGTKQAPNASFSETGCVFSKTNYWAESSEQYLNLNTYEIPTTGENAETPETNAILRARNYVSKNGGEHGRLLTQEEFIPNISPRYKEIFCGSANVQKGTDLDNDGEYDHFLLYWMGGSPNGTRWKTYVYLGYGYNMTSFSVPFDRAPFYGVRPIMELSSSVF